MNMFEQFLTGQIGPGEFFMLMETEGLTKTDAALGLKRAHDHLVNLKVQERCYALLNCRAILQDYREKRISYDQLKEKLHMDEARIKELLSDNADLTQVLLWRTD
jgi:plasmid maintenance system antidote protein VapI